MPIYEYECQACAHRFEAWQKMSDKPIKVCPKCRGRKVSKLISHTSFQLKGGGWYSDLYASAKPPSAASGESGGSASEKSPGAGSAPAATTATKSAESKAKTSKGGAKAAA